MADTRLARARAHIVKRVASARFVYSVRVSPQKRLARITCFDNAITAVVVAVFTCQITAASAARGMAISLPRDNSGTMITTVISNG